MTNPPALWTPGQLSERSGVAVSALHYYERHGLIHSQRNAGNQRRYPRDTLRRLAVIKAAQRLGVPLAEIRAAFERLPEGRTPGAADWAALSEEWRAALEARIASLVRLRDDLGGCIHCGCLSLEHCRLFNPDDRYGEAHPGQNTL